MVQRGAFLIFSLVILEVAFMFEHGFLAGFFTMDGLLGSALMLIMFGTEILGYIGFVAEVFRR